MSNRTLPEPKFTPLANMVLVQQDGAESRIGSIVLPESSRKQANFGTVIAVGDGTWGYDGKKVPIVVKRGDRVAFDEDARGVREISIEGNSFLLLREPELWGVVG